MTPELDIRNKLESLIDDPKKFNAIMERIRRHAKSSLRYHTIDLMLMEIRRHQCGIAFESDYFAPSVATTTFLKWFDDGCTSIRIVNGSVLGFRHAN